MKAVFRGLSFVLAVIAFVLLVIDGTGMIATRTYGLTSVAEVLARFAEPGAVERWQASLAAIHPFLSAIVSTIFLSMPAVVMATVLAFAFWLIGRRSEPELAVRL